MKMENTDIEEAKELIAELCANLYSQGHVSGTGGGISIRVGDNIVMAPSGVQKERMKASDMFVLNAQGKIIHTPTARPPPYKPPKLSECSPLFMSAFELRNAGAVLHGHSVNAVLATMIHPDLDEFRVTHLEMIKGIAGHGFYSNMVVPIIENTARECELTDRLREAIARYPKSNAVLVRRHGVYVWGDSWIQAKTQFECYEYLFEASVRMHSMGIDARLPPTPPPLHVHDRETKYTDRGHQANGENELTVSKRARMEEFSLSNNDSRSSISNGVTNLPIFKFVVLDIEGTVAPISFVADTLFPYAKRRLREHLTSTYTSDETQSSIDLLRKQAQSENRDFPSPSSTSQEIINAAATLCEEYMAKDMKITALKQIQGNIWKEGYASGELVCSLFRDVPDALAEWRNKGIKIYIYSSGSRQAQKDLFAHTSVGDLRPYIYGFFDTTSGPKVEAHSYQNIGLSLGPDSPQDILFVTDNVAEAEAAAKAGWQAVVIDRPGNNPLPSNATVFRIINSLGELLT